MAGGQFQVALAHLAELHRSELDHVRQELEAQIKVLKDENKSLRQSLGGKASISSASTGVISPEEITFEPNGQAHLGLVDVARANRDSSILPSNSHHAGDQLEQALVLHKDSLVDYANPKWEPLGAEIFMMAGHFSVKDAWNKFMETRHWGANLDAYMFASNLRSSAVNGGTFSDAIKRRASNTTGTNFDKRAKIANAAIKNVDDEEPTDLEVAVQSHDPGCSIYPNSTFRLTWDLSGLVLISYDLITIPFNLAFEPEHFWFTIGMDWITLLFWSGDMLQGFFLGYFERGMYVSDNRKILRHYMMTWFIPDAVVVVPEWCMTVLSSAARQDEGQASEMVKFLKGARAVRVLRLLRLLKLQRIINLLYDMIESEHTFICVNLAKLLLAVLVLNHVIACIWYLIGRICMEGGIRNWIQVGDIENESIMYKYSTSMHWSLTQFTPASMDISARNVFERTFSIVVLFLSLVAFSSIVASITGSMTSLRNMKTEEMKQFWLLRRYLRQREVTSDLSDRIFKYLEHQTAKQSKLVQENSLKATLPKLSMALQSELTHQLNSRFLVKHPFFHHLDSSMSVVMHRLCHVCLKLQSHAEKEVVFSAGDKASKMYFIKGKGASLEYTTVDGSRLEPPPHYEDWVGEAVLWTEWRHTGRLQSVTANDLIAVDPVLFVDVMCVHPRSWFYAKRYAAKFVEFLNSLDPLEAIDIIRDTDWYSIAVQGCDTCADYKHLMDGDVPSCEGANGTSAEASGAALPASGATAADNLVGASSRRRSMASRRWTLGSFCPWVAGSTCEPWCSSGPQQGR